MTTHFSIQIKLEKYPININALTLMYKNEGPVYLILENYQTERHTYSYTRDRL